MDKLIYLDNAATTKTSPEVVEAMLPYFTEHYGNPSSIYSFAAANKEVISKQRETIAGVIGAKENEIYFTAGGTEADNWALTATAEAYGAKESILLRRRLNIMPFCIHVNIFKSEGMRLLISMWMNMEL